MKTRTGFVSNSSSSSFIIDPTEHSLEKVEEFIDGYLKLIEADKKSTIDIYIDEGNFMERLERWNKCFSEGYFDRKNTVGKIIIDSVEDNSIPVDLQEIIEYRFDAERVHFG